MTRDNKMVEKCKMTAKPKFDITQSILTQINLDFGTTFKLKKIVQAIFS
jgi:hypothetical protein